jgi:glycosyltransferase involved in cell wall biosynthesis
LLTKLCSKRAAKIITVSDFTKSEIVELLNVTPSKVSVFYNCLPFPFEEVVGNSKQFLLIVGGLNADKRVDCALLGFKEYLQRNPSSPLQLMIAGPDQGARRQLEELSQNLGLTERCCFLGQISEDEKNKLLASCIAIVMMGRNEGFGIPVLEAMRLGKPTLAAKAGALPEVMGSAGVVVEMPENAECIADGIHEIMNSEINWVEACRAEYSRYNSSVISNSFWRCLTEI